MWDLGAKGGSAKAPARNNALGGSTKSRADIARRSDARDRLTRLRKRNKKNHHYLVDGSIDREHQNSEQFRQTMSPEACCAD